MKRMLMFLSVVLVMVAMVVATAVPAFAGAVVSDIPCGVPGPGGSFELVTGHSVVTPSGNSNLSCHANPHGK